jgi:hypothetical protein
MKEPGNRLAPLMRIVLILSLALIAGLWALGAQAQRRDDLQYFSKTGHNVRGDFLEFFREHGEIEIFGYPITEEFVLNGRVVQYFQRARMELHPENAPGARVELGLLGEELGRRQPPIGPANVPPADDPDRIYFAETGHTVGFSFLRFFNTHGGVGIFGYPISEDFTENGRRVQYFQRARMEFYSDRPQGQQVQLADLGEVQFDQARLDPALRRPAPARLDGAPASGITRLRVDASVGKTYAAYPGQQTLHVYVLDDQNRGVQGAFVKFEVVYPSFSRSFEMEATDASGYTAKTFDLEPAPVAQKVVVRVTAAFESLSENTQTSFFSWK